MKAKSLNKSKDWRDTWLQTTLSIVGLAFAVLVGFGVITPAQSAEAGPLVTSTLTAVSSIIAGVIALIGVFAKQDDPVV
jgi:hypothetical protein